MWYVYYLHNELNKSYIGITNDLRRRLSEHNKGYSTYTSGHNWRIIYYEAYLDKRDAYRREHRLKEDGRTVRQLRERINASLIKS